MADNEAKFISNPLEQKIWDETVAMIVEAAQLAQKLQFYKYKLDYHLEKNSANKNILTSLVKKITGLNSSFNDFVTNKIKIINKYYAENATKFRIGIILDTAKNKLQTILTYNELKSPKFSILEEKVKQRNLAANSESPATQTINKTNQNDQAAKI